MYMNINVTKFSQKWVDGFMTHHNLVNRRKTTVAQQLSDDYVELQTSFFILYTLLKKRESISVIVNCKYG